MTLQELRDELRPLISDEVPERLVCILVSVAMVSHNTRLEGLPECVRDPLVNRLTYRSVMLEVAQYKQQILARKS